MHNSQGGADVNSDAIETLLANDCVGCHSSIDSSTTYSLGGSTVPVVHYTGSEPTEYLAGGNFWWVKEGLGGDDSKGHNVFFNEGDEALTSAPGAYTSGCGSNSCHDNLHQPAGSQGGMGDLEGKYGCQGCHLNVAHHANDGPSGDYKLVTTAEQGWYRFLSGHQGGDGHGVEGGEDPDWQATTSPSDHNEYLGKVDSTSWGFSSGKLGHTTTAFCTGCHGMFHGEQTNDAGAWIRHPSDAVIPDSGEYSAYTTYNIVVPVARETLPAVPGTTVEPGADMVMCLSCHRPHGSPYSDILRWDYDKMIAGGGGGADGTGCFVCHTNKDGS